MIIAQSRIHCAKERCSVDHYAEFFYDARPIASLLDKPSSCLPAIWQPKKYYDPRKSVYDIPFLNIFFHFIEQICV